MGLQKQQLQVTEGKTLEVLCFTVTKFIHLSTCIINPDFEDCFAMDNEICNRNFPALGFPVCPSPCFLSNLFICYNCYYCCICTFIIHPFHFSSFHANKQTDRQPDIQRQREGQRETDR